MFNPFRIIGTQNKKAMKTIKNLNLILTALMFWGIQSNAQSVSYSTTDLTGGTSSTLLVSTTGGGGGTGSAGVGATGNNNCSGSADNHGASDPHINTNDCQGCAEQYAKCVGTFGGNDSGCQMQLDACKIQFRCGW